MLKGPVSRPASFPRVFFRLRERIRQTTMGRAAPDCSPPVPSMGPDAPSALLRAKEASLKRRQTVKSDGRSGPRGVPDVQRRALPAPRCPRRGGGVAHEDRRDWKRGDAIGVDAPRIGSCRLQAHLAVVSVADSRWWPGGSRKTVVVPARDFVSLIEEQTREGLGCACDGSNYQDTQLYMFLATLFHHPCWSLFQLSVVGL